MTKQFVRFANAVAEASGYPSAFGAAVPWQAAFPGL
jgi:hypothetical protein